MENIEAMTYFNQLKNQRPFLRAYFAKHLPLSIMIDGAGPSFAERQNAARQMIQFICKVFTKEGSKKTCDTVSLKYFLELPHVVPTLAENGAAPEVFALIDQYDVKIRHGFLEKFGVTLAKTGAAPHIAHLIQSRLSAENIEKTLAIPGLQQALADMGYSREALTSDQQDAAKKSITAAFNAPEITEPRLHPLPPFNKIGRGQLNCGRG